MRRLLAAAAFLGALALVPSALADTPLYKRYDLGTNLSYAAISPGGTQVVYTTGSESYLWNDGTPIDLGAFQARGVDDSGDVVGSETVDGKTEAVEWSNGSLKQLAAIENSDQSYAVGVNDAGQIAGEAEISGGYRPVRWDADGASGADLFDPLACDPAQWGSAPVNGITAAGLVYGQEALPPDGSCFDGYNVPAVALGGGAVTYLMGTTTWGNAVASRSDGTIFVNGQGGSSFAYSGGAATALTGLDSVHAAVVGGDDAGDAIGWEGADGGVIQFPDGREAPLTTVSTAGNTLHQPFQVGGNGDIVGVGTNNQGNTTDGFLLHRVTSLGFSIAPTQQSYTIPASGYATIVYQLEIANHGPDDATGVSVTFGASPSSVFSYAGSTGSCGGSVVNLVCNVGTIAAGASTSFTITVHAVAAGRTGTSSYNATAYLQATTADAGAVTDLEGGQTTLTVASDTTPPTISFTGPAAGGWFDSPVTLTWSCADSGSGPVSPTVTELIAVEGLDRSATGTCTDGAGNTSTDTESGYDVDLTPPVVTATPSRAPDHDGWYTAPFTVAWSGTDALSGVASCDPDTDVSVDTASGSATGWCADVAGNVGSAELDYELDQTPPALSVADETVAAGEATLTSYSDVHASDSESTPTVDCTPALPATFAVGTTNVSCTATDAAGNATTRTFTVTVTAASTPPSGTTTPPTTTTSTSSPSVASAAVMPDASGSLVAPEATVAWPAGAVSAASTITVQPATGVSTPTISGAPGDVVSVTVTAADGTPIHTFSLPLEIDFPNADPSFVPSTSEDGVTWRAIPLLPSPSLPAGQADGYVRDGTTIRVFTHHLSLFGIGRAAVAPTVGGSASLHGRTLSVLIRVSRPAHVTIELRRKGATLAHWLRDVTGARTIKLRVAAGAPGETVRLEARAGAAVGSAVVAIHRD